MHLVNGLIKGYYCSQLWTICSSSDCFVAIVAAHADAVADPVDVVDDAHVVAFAIATGR